MLYRTVVIDPPWLERGAGKIKRGADRHYELMPTPQIITALQEEISPLLSPDCHCWLWVTNNFLLHGLDVLKALGFRYLTNIVWVKNSIGLGQYLRGQHELCLFGVRGKTMLPEHRDVPSVLHASKGEHSQKPSAAFRMIARVSPEPRLEVFARDRHIGFDRVGRRRAEQLVRTVRGTCSSEDQPAPAIRRSTECQLTPSDLSNSNPRAALR